MCVRLQWAPVQETVNSNVCRAPGREEMVDWNSTCSSLKLWTSYLVRLSRFTWLTNRKKIILATNYGMIKRVEQCAGSSQRTEWAKTEIAIKMLWRNPGCMLVGRWGVPYLEGGGFFTWQRRCWGGGKKKCLCLQKKKKKKKLISLKKLKDKYQIIQTFSIYFTIDISRWQKKKTKDWSSINEEEIYEFFRKTEKAYQSNKSIKV